MTSEELQQRTYELDLQKFEFEKERQQKERDFETQQLVFTRQIEENKLELERHKAKWSMIAVFVTAFSILASVSVAGLTIVESHRLQKESTDTQFDIKAADLVLQSDDPEVNANKAARFQELFPTHVPSNWTTPFDWKRYAVENDDMKVAFIQLLAEHPAQKDKIIGLYKALFPEDDTVQKFLGEVPATVTHR